MSAQAYASVPDLKTEVEFQYKLLRRELPLRNRAKVAALLCAIMPVPGILIFVGLLSDYRKHRYDRQAKEFKCWYWLGIAVYVAIVVACVVFL